MNRDFRTALNHITEEAAKTPPGNVCRVCHIVSGMPAEDVSALNDVMVSKAVTNQKLADLLTSHFGVQITAKSISRHRNSHVTEGV